MKLSTRQIALVGMLGAITVALGLMPVGGFIPVPTPAGSATTMHLPTILAGIVEGPVSGGMVGAIFGAFSFWRAQTNPNPVAKLMFTNPLIAFGPRILIGVVSAYVFRLVKGKRGQTILAFAAGIMVGHTAYLALVRFSMAVRWAGALLLGGCSAGLLFLVQARYGHGPALAAICGSFTNTMGVLGLAVAFGYVPAEAALAVGVLQGVPEGIVAMVLASLVYRSIKRFIRSGADGTP